MATIYYEKDTDPAVLDGQAIAVLGFGSQGHAHAQNLQDSGHDVRVGLRPGSASRAKAEEAGLRVLDTADAVAEADVIMCLLPDTSHGAVYASDIAPNLADGNMLMFAHGFSVHFGTVAPPAGVDVTMIAPKGPGPPGAPDLRAGDRHARARRGAAGRDRHGQATRAGLRRRDRLRPRRHHRDHLQGGDRDRSVRRAVGPVRRHLGADPQRVRDAGRGRLPARDRLLRVPARAEADHRPDLRGRPVLDALLACPTRPSGATTRAARGWSTRTRASRCEQVLAEIQDGTFAKQWIAEADAGFPEFLRLRQQAQTSQLEQVGRQLRQMMPWLESEEKVPS